MLCASVDPVLPIPKGCVSPRDFHECASRDLNKGEGTAQPSVQNTCSSPDLEHFEIFLLLAARMNHTFSQNKPLYLFYSFPPK